MQLPPGPGPPPCQVAAALPGEDGVVIVRTWTPLGPRNVIPVSVKHTPTSQPVHEGEPTVRLLLIRRPVRMYSTPAESGGRVDGRPLENVSCAVFGPFTPMT